MLPPPPAFEPPEPGTRTARGVAIALILSTPLSGIATFALAAVLFGEERLEGAGGLTLQGTVAYGVPAILGLCVLLWSISSVPFPSSRQLAVVCAVVAVVCLVAGLSSLRQAESGDPSIGGPLLIAFAVAPTIAAATLWARGSARNDES